MIAVSQFFGSTNDLVGGLTQAVRDAAPGQQLAISLDGIDFLSMPDLAAILSAVQTAERRGGAAAVSDLSPALVSLLDLAGVSLP
ncbi:STAS domain-containing protein [Azospirillum agricola]|uniref:STAS domain-containing protein n=1 Tax=Azospirillum agricola TaxID=1720247 RepID=UPI000A0F0FD5|nr:STAS domain-containing protein [Azospirillum agricola]SMH62412.1 STAS domain-containing protein [Azospirillum lipoferum]